MYQSIRCHSMVWKPVFLLLGQTGDSSGPFVHGEPSTCSPFHDHDTVSNPDQTASQPPLTPPSGNVQCRVGKSSYCILSNRAGHGSLVGCASAWYADGHQFDPHTRKHSFVEIGHEIISTAIHSRWFKKGSCGDWSWNNFYGHSLPLIQEGQLTGKRMCTKYR